MTQKIISIALPLAVIPVSFAVSVFKGKKYKLTEKPDFLLILGCRVRGDEPEETLKMRIDSAAEFLKASPNTIAIATGGIVHNDQTKSEAQAIRDRLVELGIESERIITEEKSRTTFENFLNCKKIIDGFEMKKEIKIAFLSSDFHLLRAGIIGKFCSVDAMPIYASSPNKAKIKNYLREIVVFPFTLIEKRKNDEKCNNESI